MIDDPFASVRPRRRTAAPVAAPTPAPPPLPDDDPFAAVAPRRDTLATHIRNTTAPERPSLLSRVGAAAKALGTQVVEDPVGTAKGIGRGLAQNVSDLAAFTPVGLTMGMPQRIAAEEGGDARRVGVRAAGAGSLLLAPGMRAMGAPAAAVLGADYLASAGLGAAQTPDDPAVGAVLGAGMNAAMNAPAAMRFRSGMIPDLGGVTKGLDAEITPRFPMRRATAAAGDGVPLNRVLPMAVVDRLGNPPTMRTQFDAPRDTPLPPTPERFPEGFTAEPTPPPVAPGALERLFPDMRKAFDPRSANDAFDVPQPRPATTEVFPEGFTAEPTRSGQLDKLIRDMVPREVLDGQRQGTLTPVPPREMPLPGTERQFPEGFTMPEPTPVKSATPKPAERISTPVDTPLSPTLPRQVPPAPRVSTMAPEPPAAPLTPPAAAAIPEAPPAPVVPPAAPPAAVDPAPSTAPVREVARETTPPPTPEPVMAPSQDGTVNWKTWFDEGSPGAQSAEARLQSVIASDPDLVKNARGYESMGATDARATTAAYEFFRDLVDGDMKNGIEPQGISAFVRKHGAAGVPALKKVIAQNEQALQDASRVVANGGSPEDVARAMEVIDGIERQQGDLLRGVVREQAGIGRGLNALKIRAKLTTDPDVWLVQAQRAAGDVPLSDDVRNEVRRLARAAADACGGA